MAAAAAADGKPLLLPANAAAVGGRNPHPPPASFPLTDFLLKFSQKHKIEMKSDNAREEEEEKPKPIDFHNLFRPINM